jgi:hypothetical protein
LHKLLAVVVLLYCVSGSNAGAGEQPRNAAAPAAFTAISPIFSQLVMFSLPASFTTVFEQPSNAQYIREAVLKGETVDKWSQMITVTGAKGLAVNPQVSAQSVAANIASGFKRACPETFAVKPMGGTRISGQDAFVAVASCGKVDTSAETHSETALIVSIKGARDVYTIQWAERTAASAENLTIDEALWKERLAKLAPIHVCPIVPGETAPYPSCVNQR